VAIAQPHPEQDRYTPALNHYRTLAAQTSDGSVSNEYLDLAALEAELTNLARTDRSLHIKVTNTNGRTIIRITNAYIEGSTPAPRANQTKNPSAASPAQHVYTTMEVKQAIADWNHPRATSRLAFDVGLWLDENNLSVVSRSTPPAPKAETPTKQPTPILDGMLQHAGQDDYHFLTRDEYAAFLKEVREIPKEWCVQLHVLHERPGHLNEIIGVKLTVSFAHMWSAYRFGGKS
jgi:hypothetical protein